MFQVSASQQLQSEHQQQQQEEVKHVDAPCTRAPQAGALPRSNIKRRREECRDCSRPSELRES